MMISKDVEKTCLFWVLIASALINARTPVGITTNVIKVVIVAFETSGEPAKSGDSL